MAKSKKPAKKAGSSKKIKPGTAGTDAADHLQQRGIAPGTIGIGVPLTEAEMAELKRKAEKLDE